MNSVHNKMFFTVAAIAGVAAGITGLRASAVPTPALPFNQLVVFGDSLSDVGNLALATAGSTTVSPPLPPYDTAGEFTDGPDTTPSTSIIGVWVQQLNNNFLHGSHPGFAPLTPSLSGGTDYAFGGAATGSSLTPPGMAAQVDTFLNADPVAPSSNLYVFWGGANDILDAASQTGASLSSIETAASTAAANIDSQIQQIANAGGKYFLWVNMPPLNQTPGAIAAGTLAQYVAAQATTSFNTAWQSDVTSLNNSGIHVLGENVNALFSSILADPSQDGFTNVTTPARGLASVKPDTYLFWGNIHPTTAADKLLAQQSYSDINNSFGVVPEPAALLLLAAGLAGMLLLRRAA